MIQREALYTIRSAVMENNLHSPLKDKRVHIVGEEGTDEFADTLDLAWALGAGWHAKPSSYTDVVIYMPGYRWSQELWNKISSDCVEYTHEMFLLNVLRGNLQVEVVS